MIVSRALAWWYRVRRTVLLYVAKVAGRTSRYATREAQSSGVAAWRSATLPAMRYSVCEKCPLLTANKFCRKPEGCGCHMPSKVQLPRARCPLGKW